ncbi:sensor histidine kinase [Brevibacillus aydinogluensis]|jgi:two-component system, OmpR family, phosphate regulon sensor histidine kinase PhoR|uniref:histidine kinase n=1 Tax=Brevibacillus aydinogluensis TaxID=927786 RepID=A0AA48M8T9_9BACL|nr:HAMP domain-containing sensor histidine kinase [Brevibacillus aydinogluensis]CAJ1002767.1 histidine kinase [Brevibacillus aydinogluensis]
MKGKRILRHAAGIVFVVGFFTACWSAVYFLMSQYAGGLTRQMPDYVRQLITVMLGYVLAGILMASIGILIRSKQRMLWQSLYDALRRIAKGDFNVNLQVKADEHHPLGQLVESINHMAVELSQMEKMRQEFISNVSHEIQSPLTSISGFARALQNERLSREERLHYLSIIETECQRLSKLSDNLLKLTSLESDHHPFEPKRYRLDRQLRQVILACEPQWADKAIDMDVSLEEVYVVADEELMSQVWVNLLHNSVKFTPHGGSISVRLEQDGQHVIVCVADTGIGIAEEDLPHLFERFFKADKSRNRSSGGSGLGLSIVKKIVDMHHGTISVTSKPGEGAAFTVTLPLNNSEPLLVRMGEERLCSQMLS